MLVLACGINDSKMLRSVRIADETVWPSGVAHSGALMARYFFHIKGGASLIEDEEGSAVLGQHQEGSEYETAEEARTAVIQIPWRNICRLRKIGRGRDLW
jgi:hypothetical protein